ERHHRRPQDRSRARQGGGDRDPASRGQVGQGRASLQTSARRQQARAAANPRLPIGATFMLTRLLRALDAGLGHLAVVLGLSALLLSFFAFVTRYFLPAYALNGSWEVIVF